MDHATAAASFLSALSNGNDDVNFRQQFPAYVRSHRAYRKLSLKAHPDKGGSPAAFRRLKKAHEVLQDPDKRIL